LDGASNYIIWNARMSFLLDDYGLKIYADNTVAEPIGQQKLANFRKEMAKAKRMILDGVRDHIVS